MRIVLLPTLLIAASCTIPKGTGDALGVWRVNSDGSTGPHLDIVAVRFERHSKGEVFTLDGVNSDGRGTTSSTIPYFDGKPHDFQDWACSGTQSSWQVDSTTIEILRKCANGELIRFVRQSTGQPEELALAITDQKQDGHYEECHLVLKKQFEVGSNAQNKFQRQGENSVSKH